MFARAGTLFDFLASIDGTIHVHVRQLYEHANPPRFVVVSRDATQLQMRYQSTREMAALAAGLVEGAAAHYGEAVVVTQTPDPAAGATLFSITRRAA
jgi:hypothetical protein